MNFGKNAPTRLPTSHLLLRVNLLKQWFGRHPHRHTISVPVVQWPGHSGKEYAYKFGLTAPEVSRLRGNYDPVTWGLDVTDWLPRRAPELRAFATSRLPGRRLLAGLFPGPT